MPLASLDPLAGVITSQPTGLGGLDALAVDDDSTGFGHPAPAFPFQLAQGLVDPPPGSVIPPFAVVIVDAVVVGVVLGQVLPLTASTIQVKNGIDHLAQVQLRRTPRAFPFRGKQGPDDLPLFAVHIAGVPLLPVQQ